MKKETKTQETAPMRVTRQVKHVFNLEETAAIQRDFHQAYRALAVKNSEFDAVKSSFDAVKSSYKAAITEFESRLERLSAVLDAGFDLRDKEHLVVFRVKDKEKDFYLPPTTLEDFARESSLGELVLTEPMTPDDFQQELLRAEAIYEAKEEIIVWEVGSDLGRIIVGRLAGKWYAAARANVGNAKIEERLDSEQKAFKKRYDAIGQCAIRVHDWLEDRLGKENAKGFQDPLHTAVEAHREREE